MKLLLAAIFALCPFTGSSLSVHTWVPVLRRIVPSLVNVESDGKRVCTGFVIHSTQDLILSANHCWHEPVTVDGKEVSALWYDETNDLMILHVQGLDKPSLRPRRNPVVVGLPAMAVGYAYGYGNPQSRTGSVASDSSVPSPSIIHFLQGQGVNPGGGFLALDFVLINGQSGGPIVDMDGKVLSLVQMDDGETGWSRTHHTVMTLTGKYWDTH